MCVLKTGRRRLKDGSSIRGIKNRKSLIQKSQRRIKTMRNGAKVLNASRIGAADSRPLA